MKRFLSIMFLLAVMLSANAIKKSNVSVLYVGGSSDIETFGADYDSIANVKSTIARKAAFKKLLTKYFKTVKCIDASEYTPEMSDKYDVTVMDGKPKALKPKVMLRDKNGKVIKYNRATYLPWDFDRPMLTIADASEEVTRLNGTKNDWYCLCLDADAHHTKLDHPIFNGPWKVNIRQTLKPTPASAKDFQFEFDEKIPDSLLMWTVQTKGYGNSKGFRVGMVSRDNGYLDSPEAEFISSGACAKSPEAVAIGRHGNFLHWGFSASPIYMTEAGKVAFVNAIVYISKFAGQTPIARKYDDVIITRHALVSSLKHTLSYEGYEDNKRLLTDFNKTMQHIRDSLAEVKKNGGKIGQTEEMYLNMPLQEIPTMEQFFKDRGKKYYDVFGVDPEAISNYFKRNYNYLYPEQESYTFVVDDDAKYFGFANNDKRLLDAAISAWEQGKDIERAKRVLKRYTLCRFDNVKDWRNWYDKWNSKMFFTESGGWLFLINSRDKDVVGNDYQVLFAEKDAEIQAILAAENGGNQTSNLKPQTSNLQEPTKQNPVVLDCHLSANKEVIIDMNIYPDYHIYANVDDADPYIVTKVEITPSKGWEKDGVLRTPSVTALNAGSKTTVYTGKGQFVQKLKGSGKGTVKVSVEYQCCDNTVCLPPQTKEFELTL